MLRIRYCVLRSIVMAGLSLAAAIAAPPSSALAAAQDGNWSVLVVTEKGKCDRGYRYSVAVANGQVVYKGDTAVNLSGTVASNGAVKVSIKFGGQAADYAGRWEAERR